MREIRYSSTPPLRALLYSLFQGTFFPAGGRAFVRGKGGGGGGNDDKHSKKHMYTILFGFFNVFELTITLQIITGKFYDNNRKVL